MKNDRIQFARGLRKDQTPTEQILWQKIRAHQINGFKFRRQQEFASYILDFYCHKIKLVIEIDGDVHAHPQNAAKDQRREQYLKHAGLHVFRVNNNDIRNNLTGVLERIHSLTLALSQRIGDSDPS